MPDWRGGARGGDKEKRGMPDYLEPKGEGHGAGTL